MPPKTEEPVAPPATAAEPAAAPEEDWETRFKYLLADFENFRKRTGKERESQRLQAHAALLSRLLPLYEAARRAVEAVSRLAPTDPVRRGVELLVKEWAAVLDAEGVRPVARVGGPFVASLHEAVAEAPPTSSTPAGSVVEIVQQGYALGAALLRPAKVVVARAPPPASAAAAVSADATSPDDGE